MPNKKFSIYPSTWPSLLHTQFPSNHTCDTSHHLAVQLATCIVAVAFGVMSSSLTTSSNSAPRFRQHVGFDNLPAGDSTKNNTSSFTLHVKHQGYQPSRRSRTFMVGVDEHAYSDYALVWLLNNMVDDGDQVVCVRVIENPIRPGEKSYQEEAKKLLQTIQSKNEQNRAISIILEWAVGKLHSTFQKLVRLLADHWPPSVLLLLTGERKCSFISTNPRCSLSAQRAGPLAESRAS